MSQQARHAVHRCRAKNGCKLLLLVLAEFVKADTDECWADENTLADMCSMSARQVRRCIQSCVRDGFLEIVNEPRWQDGRRLAREFRLKLPDIFDRVTGHFCQGAEGPTEKAGQKCPPIYNKNKHTSNAAANKGADKPPEIALVTESNSPPSLDSEIKLVRKREDVLGKGLTDEQWLRWLGEKNPNIDIPVLFDRCLAWCKDKSKVASRRQFMAFVRNAQKDVPMAVVRRPSAPSGQSAFERELAEIRMAVGA